MTTSPTNHVAKPSPTSTTIASPHTTIAGTLAPNAFRLVSTATMPSVLRSSIIGTETTAIAKTRIAKKPPTQR